MSQNYVLKNVSKLCPEKYVSENVLNKMKMSWENVSEIPGHKFWPEKQAKISGQNFWPEIKFWPADELTLYGIFPPGNFFFRVTP